MASKTVVIVESPAKAKTIEHYLGKGYEVKATYGHVRDLKPKEGAVDPEHDFAMTYVPIDKNKKYVQAIAQALKGAQTLCLSTDPDREGEAISFHLLALLNEMGVLEGVEVQRVVFYEITKKAVLEAMAQPRTLSMELINAQQARRALDYLVGFYLSPLLWRKVKPGLSAGRVQSPALRMICEREQEIEAFVTQEYWSIHGDGQADTKKIQSRLVQWQGEKLKPMAIADEAQAQMMRETLEKQAKGQLLVLDVVSRARKRQPAAPFTTSTLQQEAARKLGFGAQKTMRVAQQLYEGVQTDEGHRGLITYMRTDSVTLSQEAIADFRSFIEKRFGSDNVPDEPRTFKTKTKNAQEAHEAIRPTQIGDEPEKMRRYLSAEQYKLYDLIWKRSLASQMAHADLMTVSIDMAPPEAQDNVLRATGTQIIHAGFLKLYEEGRDDPVQEEDQESFLPPLKKGDAVQLNEVSCQQHFTEPPPRFSEASLVKALEEYGIGRPSTYASIISTLTSRAYVSLENKRFEPTDMGRVVNKFLTSYFSRYVEYSFTADLEDNLDAVSRGEQEWLSILRTFYDPFNDQCKDVAQNVKRSDVTTEDLDEKCPECQSDLKIRLGKRGRFIGCSNYPECTYTRSLNETHEEAQSAQEVLADKQCPSCASPLALKQGRYGKFIGCTEYPKCKHIEPLEKPKDTGITCPTCQEGVLMERKSRFGKAFFGCSKYPTCSYAVWNPPLAQPCPQCQWPVTTIKTTKRKGTEVVCPQKECGYAAPYEQETPAES